MSDCTTFLEWALPRLGLRWAGFRRVRNQVCKRISRRYRELGLKDFDEYRSRLTTHPEEWIELAPLCHVTISRFYRDGGVFDRLSSEVLPALATSALEHADGRLRAWCAGCGAGEEAYTLAIIWHMRLSPRFPTVRFTVLGTDADEGQIGRARAGCYRASSLRELPDDWKRTAFAEQNGKFCIGAGLTSDVEFRVEDLRERMPAAAHQLVLCRNVAFTYFAEPEQRATAAQLAGSIVAGGALVLGKGECLPEGTPGFVTWSEADRIYRRMPC